MATEVIVYRYDASPFASKLENILLLRNIPYSRVNVPIIPPRPQLLQLGIPYRRVPVVAIGNDVFCDTFMITTALERAFPPSQEHPSIFSARKDGSKVDRVLQLHFSQAYSEKQLFGFGRDSMPWTKVPPALAQDRFGDMAGAKAPPPSFFEKLEARQPITRSTLITHLDYLEEQLSDGRQWLFDTLSPNYADAATHMPLAWIRSFRSMRDVLDKSAFPHTVAWLARFDALVKERSKTVQVGKLDAAEAAKRVTSSSLKENVQSLVGFDDEEAKRLSLTYNTSVAVTPDDTGKIPTVGKLVGLSRREIVIQIESEGGRLAVHFPRLGFVVKAHDLKDKSKL